MDTANKTERRAVPWNKGKLLGQKPPLKLKEIWAIPRIAPRHAHPTLPLQRDRTAWYGSGIYPSGYGHGRCCSQ
jgi:hypothetical protein